MSAWDGSDEALDSEWEAESPRPDSPAGASNTQSSSRGEQRRWAHDAKKAAVGGVIALLFALATGLAVGLVSPWRAHQLVESLVAVLPYFGSAAMGGGITILALMLTLLGVGQNASARFSEIFYTRIVWIGRQACAVFGGSVALLLVMAAPVQELQGGDTVLFQIQFYAIAGLLALLSGMLTSTLSMLQSTLEDLVNVVGIGVDEHPLLMRRETSAESK